MKEFIFKLIDLIDRRATFTAYLVIAMTVMAFTFTVLLMFHAPPKDSESIMYGLVGGVWGSVTTIVTFKFGSSAHGQKTQDELAAKEK